MTPPRRRTPRLTGALLAALLLGTGLFLAGPAAAHEEVPGVRNVLDAVTPALPTGVRVQVLVSAADQLVVENRTATELTVLGEQGEPFLRIGREGVLANLRSPAWHLSNDPEGARVPPDADPAKPPRWARVSAEPSWGWFDHRLHRTRLTVPPSAAPGASVTLEEWSVPARYGDSPVTFRGHREYRQPGGAFVARVDSTPPAVTATVLAGPMPGLLVQAPGAGDVAVLGAQGEPFVRFTGRGAEVNQASPTWALTVRARSGVLPPGEVGAKAPARWVLESSGRSLLWLEPRARYAQEQPPAAALATSSPTTVLTWEVPVLAGGRTVALRGTTQWVPESARTPSRSAGPTQGSSRWPYLLGGLLGVVVLALGGALLRQRR